jgi:hypothetical protein
MAQTQYQSILVSPKGYRVLVQSGTHAFTTGDLKVTCTVHMRKLLSEILTPEQVVSSKHTSAVGSYLPYVSTTQHTDTGLSPFNKVIVSRKRGAISGLKFSYTFVGY